MSKGAESGKRWEDEPMPKETSCCLHSESCAVHQPRTVGGALIALALKDIRKAVTDIVRATLGFWMKARPATKACFLDVVVLRPVSISIFAA
jgi:hypothetical protein